VIIEKARLSSKFLSYLWTVARFLLHFDLALKFSEIYYEESGTCQLTSLAEMCLTSGFILFEHPLKTVILSQKALDDFHYTNESNNPKYSTLIGNPSINAQVDMLQNRSTILFTKKEDRMENALRCLSPGLLNENPVFYRTLGDFYFFGTGVCDKDYSKAFELFTKAASLDDE